MFKSPALGKTRRASNTPNKVPNLVYNNPEPYNERKAYNPSGRPYFPRSLQYYMKQQAPENVVVPENVVAPNTVQSWNYFPAQKSSFYGKNPLALLKLRNRTLKGEVDPYEGPELLKQFKADPSFVRGQLSRHISNARYQVFPVAARKTRHRKNRKSRKSRR